MNLSKKKISRLISIIGILFIAYKVIDFTYYYTFNGNDDIHFLKIEESKNHNYEEIFQLDELKNKYVYATLNNRADWKDFREDINSMKMLQKKYNKQNLIFLYTADDINGFFNEYEWKKLIKKYDLKGYHINLPQGYEWNLQYSRKTDSGTVTSFPKYMIISNKGKIIKKSATRPRNAERLIFELDSIMN
ncbi:hypothetical protein [Winogradskyella sp.]|uniref:hypothetical protein n=1 Tax=Winogradskyella sp. TaxID=1883156 RepID=UPI0025F24F31|nr:hypothetical protein [Winogradskyella sp.]